MEEKTNIPLEEAINILGIFKRYLKIKWEKYFTIEEPDKKYGGEYITLTIRSALDKSIPEQEAADFAYIRRIIETYDGYQYHPFDFEIGSFYEEKVIKCLKTLKILKKAYDKQVFYLSNDDDNGLHTDKYNITNGGEDKFTLDLTKEEYSLLKEVLEAKYVLNI